MRLCLRHLWWALDWEFDKIGTLAQKLIAFSLIACFRGDIFMMTSHRDASHVSNRGSTWRAGTMCSWPHEIGKLWNHTVCYSQDVTTSEADEPEPSRSDSVESGDKKRQKWVSENLERHSSWALRDKPLQSTGTQTFTWGRGDTGQLASGHNQDIAMPSQPEDLVNRRIGFGSGNLYNTVFLLGEWTFLILESSPRFF